MRMKAVLGSGLFTVLAAGTVATAGPTLQFDINAIQVQAMDKGGLPSAFGGLTHNGSLSFSLGQGYMAGVFIGDMASSMVNQNFAGTLTGVSGQIDLSAGQITGGSILITINGGADSYSAQILAAGQVSTFIGGGYTIDGLTASGVFSDALFGNVDVAAFFGQPLIGSFLQFNFNPGKTGNAAADLDMFVQIVPLPPAAGAGLVMLLVLVGVRSASRRVR
jgi:hypothetical protein